MSIGCVTQSGFTSGSQITGLTQGTPYYVTITANASTGYLAATSTVAGPFSPTVQLNAPSNVTLSYGPTAGSITVTFTAPTNAAVGQTYTAQACTNALMTLNCITPQAITSGGSITGLTYTQGSAGTAYYVTITANASTGYLAATSGDVGPQNATSQVNAATTVNAQSSTTTAGSIFITFTASSGTAPSSYSAVVCTNAAMTTLCNTTNGYTSGTAITGLTPGTTYYAEIIANPPAGYVSATSAVDSGVATIQLNAPTSVSLSAGTTSGSLTVTFSAPSNAAGGPDVLGGGLHQLGYDVELRDPGVYHFGWSVHVTHGRYQLLRDGNRERLDRVPGRDLDGHGDLHNGDSSTQCTDGSRRLFHPPRPPARCR